MKSVRLKILSSVLSLATFCGTLSYRSRAYAREDSVSTRVKVGIGATCGAVVLGAGALILYSLLHNNDNSVAEKTVNTVERDKDTVNTQRKLYDRAEPIRLLKLDINAPVILGNVEIVESGKSKRISGITDDSLLAEISKDKKVGIVDAANCRGVGGGGVDGVIFDSMGTNVAKKWILGNVPAYKNGDRIHEGGALLHSGFGITDKYKNIPYVIQTVSPKLNDEKDLELLYSAYYNAVKLGLDYGCETLVIPAVGMGIFCNNKTEEFGVKCAKVAAQAMVKAQKDCNKKAKIIFTDHYDDRRSKATESFFKQLAVLGAKRV